MKYTPCADCGVTFPAAGSSRIRCPIHRADPLNHPPMPPVPDRVTVSPDRQGRVNIALKLARKASAVPALSPYVQALLDYVDVHKRGLPLSRSGTLALLGHDITG